MVGRAGILVTVALTVAAACGGAAAPSATPAASAGASAAASAASVPTTVAGLAAYQGADRQQILEAGAKKEGRVVWYTSLAGAAIDRLAAAFKTKYPFITQVDIFRGTESQLVTKATQELQAGQPSFDVIESQISAIQLLFQGGYMTPYYSPSAKDIPADFKTESKGGLIESATDRFSLISFGYNTNLIPPNAVPKTLDDLMNPALKGKLAVTGTNTGQRWLGSVLEAKGQDKGQQWLKDFVTKQQVQVQQVSGQALLDLIAKGEVAGSPTIFKDHTDLAAAEKKAPVKWVPLEPVVGNTGQDAMSLKATHPNAALLFIDFLLGKDGQAIYHDNKYATAGDKLDFKVWVPEHGKTTDQIDKDTKLWSTLFKQIFR
ncbi:MAG: extracellular solute-binding protein [Chloroflexota bacterium]|nr:extracellular solute-binding protein [Chloroflexota bacterium]